MITLFMRNVLYPLTQGHRTQLEILIIEKLTNQKLFLLFKRYYHLIHINMHHFKDIQTVYVNSLPYCFYYIYSGIAWGHYQWISKLLIQIALCEHVYDNGTQIVKPKF